MFNISSYLQKLTKNLNSAELQTKQILSIVEKHSKITIQEGMSEVKNYILYTKISPGEKSKIFLNKEKILKEIKNNNITLIDIR